MQRLCLFPPDLRLNGRGRGFRLLALQQSADLPTTPKASSLCQVVDLVCCSRRAPQLESVRRRPSSPYPIRKMSLNYRRRWDQRGRNSLTYVTLQQPRNNNLDSNLGSLRQELPRAIFSLGMSDSPVNCLI